ncbi:MAG TPA: MATE family efflux transporter [bacterium]|nr:MATE family efflux transporter [bacterium]HNT66009.1 MATE family efflux transporter [bacterium]HOX86058.1 MATE family efflux transporter [bacterium]HPG45728.1 MATE family efflux transporter [bacterium]HPM97493.1 MATE family efflux transporter [bacterium]
MKTLSPAKAILKTSLPAVIDLSSQTLMWTIEAIMIGKLSASMFAGHGMAIQVILVFFSVLLTFVVGSSLIINRYLGAKDTWQANHIFGQAIMLAIIMSIAFLLTWYFGAVQLFKVIREGKSALAQEAGMTYLRTLALFCPLVVTNFVALGILRATGDTHYSMMVNILINGLNLFLAPLLIFGLFGFPRLQVQGAALAAGISHSTGFLATFYLLRSRRTKLFLSFRECTRPRWKSFRALFESGLPTTIEQLTWALGQLVVTSYAAGIYVVVLSTHTVFVRIQSVLSMVYMAFSLTAMSLMGQNLGASNKALAYRTARTANRMMVILVLAIALLMVVFSKALIHVFTTDPETVAMGQKAIYLFALAQIPKALNNVLAGNLRGAGDLKWLMWTTLIFVLMFEVGLNWTSAFIFGFGIYGIWGIQAADEFIRMGLNYWRFYRGKWRVIDLQ